MRQIDIRELKLIQIEILDQFDAFCKKNNIHYWLDYGTLLGAVRHGGYIPWDDDIDIGMMREDYSIAEKLFNEQTDRRYKLFTPQNNPDHRYPFGKLVRTDTVLLEYGSEGIRSSVYVDVFPYDNAPDDEHEKQRMFKKRDLLGRIRRLQLPMRDGMTQPKKLMYRLGAALLSGMPQSRVNRMLDKNAKKYENKYNEFVCDFADPYDTRYLTIPRSLFENFIEIEFEGKKYPAPAAYDTWLKAYYGNYMQLPPIEEQKSHHVFEAFYLDSDHNI